ncbi:hypothetical protein KC19_VG235900 [Ceratodon purpureus]|uniref:Uncharacterized protein n=1 Tax=Ceratodon purpureus TaxID=3225 RepID=A0A8T0HT49_CERPU|nr:hypothetical protein KC19_VG235900 [Ceratodon purpureus]
MSSDTIGSAGLYVRWSTMPPKLSGNAIRTCSTTCSSAMVSPILANSLSKTFKFCRNKDMEAPSSIFKLRSCNPCKNDIFQKPQP